MKDKNKKLHGDEVSNDKLKDDTCTTYTLQSNVCTNTIKSRKHLNFVLKNKQDDEISFCIQYTYPFKIKL